jgi:hypothetical protein
MWESTRYNRPMQHLRRGAPGSAHPFLRRDTLSRRQTDRNSKAPFLPPRRRVACGGSETAASACHDTMLGAKAPVRK